MSEVVDKSEDLMNDEDLLSMLGDGDKSELEEAMKESEEKEADRKMEELRQLTGAIESSIQGQNVGSGDIDEDLKNWFDGKDTLPSDDLTGYVSNPTVKMDYGLTQTTLSNFGLMGKLRKFIENDAFELLFSDSAIMGLESEALESRMKLAADMYTKVVSLNSKVINDMRNIRLKSQDSTTDLDKLQMLLSSIPSQKLEDILKSLAFEEHKK